jgi:four helix bundle protein
MGRFQGDLPARSFEFAKQIVSLSAAMPQNNVGWVLGKQVLRSGTSIGANIHEADHAFSVSDFAHKCSLARKEASETWYWLRLCVECDVLGGEQAHAAIGEADELVRVLGSLVKKMQES